MAYIYTPFMKKVLHITERKRKSNVQHDCKSYDFRARFEVAKWGVFCHSKTLQISPALFKQVYFHSAKEPSTHDRTMVHVLLLIIATPRVAGWL